MYLDLLTNGCFPTWLEVFAIAERVLATLESVDKEFYSQIKQISGRNFTMNQKVTIVVPKFKALLIDTQYKFAKW